MAEKRIPPYYQRRFFLRYLMYLICGVSDVVGVDTVYYLKFLYSIMALYSILYVNRQRFLHVVLYFVFVLSNGNTTSRGIISSLIILFLWSNSYCCLLGVLGHSQTLTLSFRNYCFHLSVILSFQFFLLPHLNFFLFVYLIREPSFLLHIVSMYYKEVVTASLI